MPLQLSCNNVLVQFLFQDLVLVLVNLDNTVNFTVDVFYKLVDCLEKCLIYGHIRRFAN